ncbi:MAG: GGDEF domain-containing protein [Kordiimonadaceae bacterium]|nr:GGDEF domain-containing protein [Kordiimonadaceae bacterium]
MLDVPTLSVAVIVVMALASVALIAHWRVNKKIDGLRSVTLGFVCSGFGAVLIFANRLHGSYYIVLLGFFLVVMGHVLFWLGFTSFWSARSRLLSFFLKMYTGLIIAISVYMQMNDAPRDYQIALVSLSTGLLAFGCMGTIGQALGGSFGLYKGIIRKTSIGGAIAAALFFLHGLFGFYHAAVRMNWVDHIDTSGLTTLRSFSQLEVMVFAISFALVVIIVTVERLQAELKIQQMLDPLTKALSRRAFIEVVKAVLARARRNSEPVSIIMMDIDKFKRINTVHGRSVGDLVLAQFSDLVTEGRRAQDVFCRFGGEEFVYLLPGTGEEGAALVANRIKERISKASISPTGLTVKLSVVMGLVTARGDDLDVDSMLDVVDRRMHRAQALKLERVESA